MWRSAVLTEIPSARATCLVCRPAGEHADDLGLALGQPRRPLESRHPLPGRLDHRGRPRRRRAVPRSASSPSSSAACSGGSGVAVRPRLGHRVVGVGRGEQAGGKRELRTGGSAVVARAVEPLVVGARDRRERRRGTASARGRARCGTGAAAPAPTRRRVNGPGFCQIRAADRDSPEVVDERRAPDRCDARRIDAGNGAPPRSPARRPRPSARQGRARSGRRSRRSPPARGRSPRPPASARVAAREPASRPTPTLRRSSARISPALSARQRGDLGIECMPRSLADHPDGELIAAQHALEGGVAGDLHDPNRQRDLLALGTAELALAVPALGEMDEQLPRPAPGARAARPASAPPRRSRPGEGPAPLPPSAAGGRSGSRAGAPNFRAPAARATIPRACSRCDPKVTGAK